MNLFQKIGDWLSGLFRSAKPAAQKVFDAEKPAIVRVVDEAVEAACQASDASQVRSLLLKGLDKLNLPAYVELPVSLILSSFDITNSVGTLQQKIRAEGKRLEDKVWAARL
jgi:hypothetical protein